MQDMTMGAAAFQSLFPDFKISTGYELTEHAVIGNCEIYKQRTDGANEYAIREIGVLLIPKGTQPTNSMVNEAIKQARIAALDTMEQFIAVAGAAPLSPIGGFTPPADTASSPVPPAEEPTVPPQPENKKPSMDADNAIPPVQGDSAEQAVGAAEDAPQHGEESGTISPDHSAPISEKASALLEKVPFSAELFPASTVKPAEKAVSAEPIQAATPPPLPDTSGKEPPLLLPAPNEETTTQAPPTTTNDADEQDDGLNKARGTVITIIGKSNECYNWTAGKIAAEHPEAIINMFQRYKDKFTGPQTDQMAAVEALYPEALRRIQGIAA